MLFHPNFEDSSNADNDADFSHYNRVKDVSMDRQLKFIVEHHDTERVANYNEYVVIEFEFLADVDA